MFFSHILVRFLALERKKPSLFILVKLNSSFYTFLFSFLFSALSGRFLKHFLLFFFSLVTPRFTWRGTLWDIYYTPCVGRLADGLYAVGRPAWVDMQMATRLRIPHTFVLHTYTKPTKCHFCNKVTKFVPKDEGHFFYTSLKILCPG
jgi:hypothetical protein